MRGYSITYDGTGAAIVNNGTLAIVDYVDVSEADPDAVSSVIATNGTAIENNGTLTIGIDDGTVNSNSPYINGTITGTGTTNIYDGNKYVGE